MKLKKSKRIIEVDLTQILLDIFVISISMILSWLVRSQFSNFFYVIRRFIFLFPWILFTRVLFHFFFRIYSISSHSLNVRDISRIFKYNLIPSGILLLLRFSSIENDLIKMPLSMIAMEYTFSSVGFIVIRLLLHSRSFVREASTGFKRKIILWGEIKDIREKTDFSKLREIENIEVVAILNSNPISWNTEIFNIRILGDENEIMRISSSDETISTIGFLDNCSLTKKQKQNISNIVDILHLEMGLISSNRFTFKTFDWLEKL